MKKSTAPWIALLIMCACCAAVHAADVTLEWDRVDSAQGYRVYHRAPTGEYDYSAPAWSGPGTRCTITGLTDGRHYFVARAYAGSDQSGDSNEVMTLIGTPTPPPSPTVEPTPIPTATPSPPRGFVLLQDGVAISSLSAGRFSAQDGGRLWVVDVSEDMTGAEYSGNIVTKAFHKVGCRYHDCLTCTDLFPTREDALAAGYRPCGTCKP